jgi:hypothetical protein
MSMSLEHPQGTACAKTKTTFTTFNEILTRAVLLFCKCKAPLSGPREGPWQAAGGACL